MKDGTSLIFAAVALGVLYAGLIVTLPPGAFFSGDEGIKWLQTDALCRHRWTTLAIDPPGGDLDPEGEFVPEFLVRTDSGIRSIFPAGMPLLASAPYAVGGGRAAYLVPALAALACMLAAARLGALAAPRRWSGLAGAASVALSPLAFYGATFWEHTLAVALSTLALIPLVRVAGGQGTGVHAACGGLLLGLAAAVRLETALMIPAAAAAWVIVSGVRAALPRALALLSGAGVILAPRALYHREVFGSWLPPQMTANLPGGALGIEPRASWDIAVDLLAPVAWRPAFLAGLLVLGAAWLAGRWTSRRAGSRTLAALAAIGFGLLLAAGPLLTLLLEWSDQPLSTRERGYHSLAHTMPMLALLPLVALTPAPPPREPARFLGWAGAIYVLLAVIAAPVPGGLQWGPRLLLPAVPPLTVALIAAVARRRRAPFGGLQTASLAVAMTAGLLLQGVGLRFLVAVRSYNAAMISRVERTVPAGGVVASDFFAVPQLLVAMAPERPALYVRPGSDLALLTARLEQTDADLFWIVRNRPDGPARPEGADPVDLGAGLSLVRPEEAAGVRGFLRPPVGD